MTDCKLYEINNKICEFYKLAQQGTTSKVYLSENKEMVMKQVTSHIKKDVYEREKYMLQFFNAININWCPQLYNYDDAQHILIMSYCGERVNTSNKPVDLRKQLEDILSDLQCCNVQHNDIKESEILIQDNKVYICDYGWSSINNELSCNRNIWNGEKPCNIYKDDTLLKRLGYLL